MTAAPADRAGPGPKGQERSRLSLWGPLAAYMALIFIGSSIPNAGDIAPGVADKPLHLVEYAGLGLLALRAFAGGAWKGVRLRAVLAAVVVAVVYGLTDEVHQRLVPGRQFDLHDLAADAAGAAAAAVAAWTWVIIRRFSGPKSGRA